MKRPVDPILREFKIKGLTNGDVNGWYRLYRGSAVLGIVASVRV